ncbi:zinc finger, CCHC-type containing protein [Tanacetum coccineum]
MRKRLLYLVLGGNPHVDFSKLLVLGTSITIQKEQSIDLSVGAMAGVDINTFTMEQYLALSRENQAPGVVKPDQCKPEIEGNDAILLRVFSFTLTGTAKRLVDRLTLGAVNTWGTLRPHTLEYCVKYLEKGVAFWSLNDDILEDYYSERQYGRIPSRKIRRVRACTYQRPQGKEDQYADSLKAKYMAEDASSKKFLVSDFTNYKMTDSRLFIEQYNELLGILEELTLVELDSHLRIEESLRVQDSDKQKGNKVVSPLVVNMVEHNNSTRYNDNKGKCKHHDNTKADPNKKSKVTCWKCGEPRHLKKDCKGVNVGNKANGSGTKGLVDGSSNSLKG